VSVFIFQHGEAPQVEEAPFSEGKWVGIVVIASGKQKKWPWKIGKPTICRLFMIIHDSS